MSDVVEKQPLTEDYLKKMDAYWRAANYLGAAQLYLLDNPLLREPLTRDQVKKKIVGHWGTVPGQNFVYVHLNRVIKKYDQDMILISGPGHGGNFFVANTYLEGTYSEVYPNIGEDLDGLKKLCKQFSFPGGISSHVAPETPGSINEGGELGYSLAHSFGAVFDNPDLIAACIVGDGESETGPLATSWQCNKFLNPESDGAVLPILHLNGYKISNPTILARISHEELEHFFDGCGWKPYFVEGDDPMTMHRKMAETLDTVMDEIKAIQKNARENHDTTRPKWPMIVLRTPKGWTGPKVVDGKQIEGSFRAHQVPIMMDKPEHLEMLKEWLLSYHPEELFDENGKLIPELKALAPTGDRRIGSNPHANGGKLLRDLRLPDFRDYALDVPAPGSVEAQDMVELGGFVRDIFKLNEDSKNFRIFGPDETMSNRLMKVFEETNRDWNNEKLDSDEFLATDGRVMDSMLSEHMCEGWLEGYLLTGRHGFFASYEAFIRVVDSMCAQHAKWLKEAGIDSINVSLDTIDASEYERITKKPLLEEVKHGINAAIECGIRVKINVVLTPQTDVVALTRYVAKKGTDIRFIEMMPVGEGHTNGVEPYKKVIGTLSKLYGEPCLINTEKTKEINSGNDKRKIPDNGPAEYYIFPELGIRVGLIQAIHGKFCDTCNRIRVTADGRLMPCLGSSVTMDLVPDSWDFADDVEKDFAIVRALRAAIKAKPRCHNFNDNEVTYTKTTETKTVETRTTELKAAEVNAARNMSRIGG